MNDLDLSNNSTSNLARKYQLFSSPFFNFIKNLLIIFVLFMILVVIASLMNLFEIQNFLLGIVFIILIVCLVFLQYYYYILDKIDNYQPILPLDQMAAALKNGKRINWSLCFDYDTYLLIEDALLLAKRNHSVLSPLYILSSLPRSARGRFLLTRLGLFSTNYQDFFNFVSNQNANINNQVLLEKVFMVASEHALRENRNSISMGDILIGIYDVYPELSKKLEIIGIEREDLANVIYWDNTLRAKINHEKRYWEDENIARTGGIGRDWAAAYTNTLDLYSYDITQAAARMSYSVIGHENEIKQLERLLVRSNKRNVVLVGDPGVGKKTIVLGFAKKIAEGRAEPFQIGKHVVQLQISRLLAGANNPREIEERVLSVFSEAAQAGNIILFIDNIQNLFNKSGGEGTVDASQIILPYLNSANLQIIGTISFDDYHNLIQSNSSLVSAFEKIEVREPNQQQTIRIVEDVVPFMEYKTSSFVTYPAIKAATELSGKYIHDMPYPEKTIELLDEVITYVAVDLKKVLVESKDVEEIISQKTKVPVGKVEKEEKEKLMNLEQFLHQRIIEQDEAITVISDAMRRARAGLASGKRPVGSFLFLGPTGVGKTETCKALAEAYFGSEKNMIRLDMSEYQTSDSVNKLVGGDTRYGYQAGVLTKAIKDNPFSLVLLDEIEKSNPDILNLFLQVMDDGRLTDGAGKQVDFTNAILIATSNAGAELIRQSVKLGKTENLKEVLIDELQKEGIFKPEFLNRFDAVVSFQPLTKEAIEKIAQLMINDLNKRLTRKDINVVVAQDALTKLAELGYTPEMGARPMRRIIQDKVENVVAKKLLSGELKKGSSYTLTIQDLV